MDCTNSVSSAEHLCSLPRMHLGRMSDSTNAERVSRSLPPRYVSHHPPTCRYLRFGNPWTSTRWQTGLPSSEMQSTSPILIISESEYFCAKSFQSFFMALL
eukprot:750713-Hanusia_phi.AAC.1